MKSTSSSSQQPKKTARLFSAVSGLAVLALAGAGAVHIATGRISGSGDNTLSLHENIDPRSGNSGESSRPAPVPDTFGSNAPSPTGWLTIFRGGDERDRFEGEPDRTDSAAGRGFPPRVYTVAEGDSWVIIAKRTLGDGSRWKELIEANPDAREGLVVGSRLIIPN